MTELRSPATGTSQASAAWTGQKGVPTRMLLLRHVADHVRASGARPEADQLLQQAREAEQQVQLVRLAVLRHEQRMKPAVQATTGDPS